MSHCVVCAGGVLGAFVCPHCGIDYPYCARHKAVVEQTGIGHRARKHPGLEPELVRAWASDPAMVRLLRRNAQVKPSLWGELLAAVERIAP